MFKSMLLFLKQYLVKEFIMEDVKGFISSELKFPTKNSTKKKRYVTFECPRCGKQESKVYQKKSFINLCGHCAKGGFTTDDFILRAEKHFGSYYDYSKTDYVNKRSMVIITCPVHGEFTQRAQEHLNGHGCNQCKFDVKKETYILPKETWLKRMEQYPLIEFKDESQIKNYYGSIDLICKIHGEFTTDLRAVGNSIHICKQCAYNAHQKQSIRKKHLGKSAYLYFVYIPRIDMYKVGVTLDLDQRLKKLGECTLLAKECLEYSEAVAWEHRIHTSLAHLRYKGSIKLIKDGSTELYKQNILEDIRGLYKSNLVSKIL